MHEWINMLATIIPIAPLCYFYIKTWMLILLYIAATNEFWVLCWQVLVYKWTWLANSNFTVSTYGSSVLCIIFCFKVYHKYGEQCSFTQRWKMCLLSYFSFFYGRIWIASSITGRWVQGCCAQRSGQIRIQFNSMWTFLMVPHHKVQSGIISYMWFQGLQTCSSESLLDNNRFFSDYIFQPLLFLSGAMWLAPDGEMWVKWCGSFLNQVDGLSPHFLSFPQRTWRL